MLATLISDVAAAMDHAAETKADADAKATAKADAIQADAEATSAHATAVSDLDAKFQALKAAL